MLPTISTLLLDILQANEYFSLSETLVGVSFPLSGVSKNQQF